MKRIFYTVLAIILAVSCQVQELVEEQDSILTFYATGESGTRTTLSDPDWYWGLSAGRSVLWSPSDEINIFCQNGGGKFVSTNTEATGGTVTFVGALEGVKDRGVNDLYWAVYPYSEDNTFDGHSIGVSLKSEQQAVLGNVENHLMISLARSQNRNLYFYNLCGIITIPVYERDIKKIIFKGNKGEPLAGKVKASFDESGCPVVSEWAEKISEITLLPPDGGTFEADKMYNLVCFPGFFEGGYTIEFYRDELVSIKQIHTPVTLNRAKYVDMTKLYTGGTIASEEYEGTTYSLNYAWEKNEGVRYWVKIGEKTFEIPDLYNVLPYDENPTRMGPAVAINTDTQVIYFAMANVSNRYYDDDTGMISTYVFDKSYIYRITASGIEKTEQEIGLYPMFRLSEQRHSLELHSYKQDYFDWVTYYHCFLEKMSNNHWASVFWLFGDSYGESTVDYSSSGYNTKTLSDIIFLYQEEFPQISLDTNAVDLGLSVKWGSCNLEARTPEQYGDQYAWGEIETKDSFTAENYKFGGAHSNPYSYWDFSGCSKYNEDDMKYFLDSGDDAAHVKLGEDWRIPTPEEWQELMDNCVWQWTSVHDVVGVVGTSKINGNCVFFPMNYTSGEYGLESGVYHSSQVGTADNSEFAGYYNDYGQAIDVLFSYYVEEGIKTVMEFTVPSRYEGAAIRPVYGHIAVEDIALDTTRIELNPGESYQLTALFSPTNATNMEVTWSSSDESAIRVSPSGVVTCIAEGKAVITATAQDGGKSASCLVNRDYCVTPEIIDLGLSVKWASFNLGASKPEEVGNYYAWGETKVKDYYDNTTYKWFADWDKCTKYCINPDLGYNGFVDNKTVLEPSDDAASVRLGGKWRMPTSLELDELLQNCECAPAVLNGVKGIWATSLNGERIFFPLTGYYFYDRINYPEGGYFWSSSLYPSLYQGAHCMVYSEYLSTTYDDREWGLPIRPVYDDSNGNGGNEGITPGEDINM